MGGSSSGGTQYLAAAAPDVFQPTAPDRGSPEAVPENIDQAGFTSGVKRTDKEKMDTTSSSLVIPLDATTQAGGYVEPKTASGVV